MNKIKTKNTPLKCLNWLLCVLLVGTAFTYAQQSHTISGTITDKSNGETLFGASLFLKGTTIGGTTNEYGFYSITAPEGEYILNISYIGYNDVNVNINLNPDIRRDVEISMEAGRSRFTSMEVSRGFHGSTWTFPLSTEMKACIASINCIFHEYVS